MRESCTYGFVRGALSNERPYRDRLWPSYGNDANTQDVETSLVLPDLEG
jgi:hypothetical protein